MMVATRISQVSDVVRSAGKLSENSTGSERRGIPADPSTLTDLKYFHPVAHDCQTVLSSHRLFCNREWQERTPAVLHFHVVPESGVSRRDDVNDLARSKSLRSYASRRSLIFVSTESEREAASWANVEDCKKQNAHQDKKIETTKWKTNIMPPYHR